MLQKLAFSPDAASRAKRSCVEAHTCGLTFHEESRPVSIVPSFTEHRFLSSIMENPAVISSLVCVPSSSVNYNFFRLNRTNLVARRFCRSTLVLGSLRLYDRYIHLYIYIQRKRKSNRYARGVCTLSYISFRTSSSGIHATEFSSFLF